MNFCSWYSSRVPSVPSTTISVASMNATVPGARASSTSPVSSAARSSIPVPTSGASVVSSGTAWRCMFEPISARLASSCSRNGIIAVATDQICSGETSTRATSLGPTVTYWPAWGRQRVSVALSLPVLGAIGVAAPLGPHAVLAQGVGSGHEAVLGDLGERGQRADQADVGTLGGLDRTHAPVVGRVHVADLDRSALARQSSGAER